MEASYRKFQDSIAKYAPEYKTIINKAFTYAEHFHQGKTRQSGMPYITHPLEVATILANMKADADTIVAGLLHDTLEETLITKEIIIKEFGNDVYKLVEGVTKIQSEENLSAEDVESASARKLIVSIAEDMRIIIIKLADRLHNMRTLQFKSKEKQLEIANETQGIYVPFAEKIVGAYEIKRELEDLSLLYIKPEEYQEILSGLQQFKQTAEDHLKVMAAKIGDLLSAKKIPHEIKTRVKNIYEIYLRRIDSKMAIEDIPNVFFLNVIVDDFQSCYQTLGWIHSLFTPMNEMTRFYITDPSPKFPMHQAIHTTVISDDKLVQAQIKTHDMDLLSNHGLIAFWQMTSADVRTKMQAAFKKSLSPYSSFDDIAAMTSNNSAFVDRIKTEILSPNIIVFTPTGEKIILPYGSTVIDFAYQIHSEIGNHLVSVRINGLNETIFSVLKNYDRVRILPLQDEITCDISWLGHVQTSRAQKCIREALKKKETKVLSI